MSRRIRKATPPPEQSKSLGPRVSGALRADQVIAGGHRLAILALAASCAIVITSVVDRLSFPLSRGSPGAALWLFGAGGGLCLSLGMALVAGRGWLSSEKLLDVGLVYEVLQALTAGLTFHAVAFAPNLPSRGSSPVSLWVLAYALIVPNTRRRTLVATIVAALMDPFSLAISVAAGMPRPEAAAAALSFMPTAISAAVAIVVSRQMYELAVAAAHGREVGSYQLEERIGLRSGDRRDSGLHVPGNGSGVRRRGLALRHLRPRLRRVLARDREAGLRGRVLDADHQRSHTEASDATRTLEREASAA